VLDVKKVPTAICSDLPNTSREYKPFFKWEQLPSLLACIRDYQACANSKNILNHILLKRVAALRCYFCSAVKAGIGANAVALRGLPAGKTAVENLASIIN
jgi:hypothetical protein